jgi:PhzF family phenazine biosynthesis protein
VTRTSLPYWHVDAFAARPFTGNQAAVMPLAAWLPDATLLAIAEENNFAETAFLVRDESGEADYELRWFTPTSEVALCGHATLAAGHVLLTRDQTDGVTFRTRKAGVLEVRRAGRGYELALPVTLVESSENAELLSALGTTGEVFASVSGAEDTAIILLPDEAAVRALEPDMRALGKINLMAICTAPGDRRGSGADVVSRVFVPAWGVDEDSVTGSAHAALAPFWAERLGRNSFTAHQASARGGDLTCRLEGERAILSGECVTVVEGRFYLDGEVQSAQAGSVEAIQPPPITRSPA